jgi:hypothetical protein
MQHPEKRPYDKQHGGVSIITAEVGKQARNGLKPKRARVIRRVCSGRRGTGHGSGQDRGRDRHRSPMVPFGVLVQTN